MTEAWADELLVNLVRDDDDVVAQTDGGKLFELRACPDTSDGIVRAAQDEEFYTMLDDLLLEVREVDFIASLDQTQGIVDDHALILSNHICKGVVDGLLNEYSVSHFRKGADGGRNRKDNAGREDELAPLNRPVMACAEPVLKDGEIVVLHLCIAEDAVLCACFEPVNDGGRGAEVHVRDPERQNVCGVAALDSKVVF